MKDYIYFVSSLPSVYIDKSSSITYNEFMIKAEEMLTKKDFETLKKATLISNSLKVNNTFLKEWCDFNFKINEILTEERAKKLSLDSNNEYKAKCIKDSDYEKKIREIVSLDNPLQAEREILSLYFDFLSSRATFDPFSLNSLINYSLKLQLKEKSDSFSEEIGNIEFNKLYSVIEENIEKGNN